MANFNQSINEGVCIDEEIFFGPVTDKERKIREHFENAYKSEKILGESLKVAENDNSRNDSLYKSFSVDDSKYDSFDDSLNEEIDEKPQETKHIPLRKSFDKLKHKKHAFYDSLEDVCSLVSNIEKCSISCEVENDSNCKDKLCIIEDSLRNPPTAIASKSYCVSEQIHFDDDSLAVVEFSCDIENESNFNDKQHIVEDSLRNPPAAVASKSCCVSEQIHFDDDSLAIVEFENTFDDSLEEFNVLSSIEIEEINDVEIGATENQGVSFKVEQNPLYASKNLFETSVQVIYEKKRETDVVDQEESSDDKNVLYDSLSNSEFKDMLKDSLEESEKCIDNLFKHVSDTSVVNIKKTEQLSALPSIKIEEMNDTKAMTIGNQNISKMDHTQSFNSMSLFDTSVQIVCEKKQETDAADQEPSDKNLLYDSLSNSEFKDILKDSLEESEKDTENMKHEHVSNTSTADTGNSEQMFIKPDILNNSVQIVYENLENVCCNKNNVDNVTNSKCDDILKDSLENFKNDNRDCSDQRIIKTAPKGTSKSYSVNTDKTVTDDNQNALYLDSNANQNCKGNESRLHSAITEPDFSVSAVENSNFNNDAFTVDSCHLKLLNDNLNIDKDLKFQLHIEVTVGDKKCKIAADDIKLLPVTTLNSKISESLTLVPVESENVIKREEVTEVLDSCNAELYNKNKEHNMNGENILYSDSNENNSCDKFKTVSAANITQRVKASVSKQLSDSDVKFNFHENVSDGNLLQALDLHDISASFLNESVIQSNDSVIPLNSCSKEQDIKKFQMSLFRNESKENLPESAHCFEEKDFSSPSGKANHGKLNYNKTPKSLQKSPSFRETTKKTPTTKIPVRKVENFAVPVVSSTKLAKQLPSALSAEKVKKHPHLHTPHSAEKKTPMTTPNKTPHFCKVRNTIFSKVPQIVPSKKYINVQSPVAQYIRNTPGSVKTPVLDPVLRDCMNHMHAHQQLESPYHFYQTAKGGSAKSTKRKP